MASACNINDGNISNHHRGHCVTDDYRSYILIITIHHFAVYAGHAV